MALNYLESYTRLLVTIYCAEETAGIICSLTSCSVVTGWTSEISGR